MRSLPRIASAALAAALVLTGCAARSATPSRPLAATTVESTRPGEPATSTVIPPAASGGTTIADQVYAASGLRVGQLFDSHNAVEGPRPLSAISRVSRASTLRAAWGIPLGGARGFEADHYDASFWFEDGSVLHLVGGPRSEHDLARLVNVQVLRGGVTGRGIESIYTTRVVAYSGLLTSQIELERTMPDASGESTLASALAISSSNPKAMQWDSAGFRLIAETATTTIVLGGGMPGGHGRFLASTGTGWNHQRLPEGVLRIRLIVHVGPTHADAVRATTVDIPYEDVPVVEKLKHEYHPIGTY
jgi:hypothetical protein